MRLGVDFFDFVWYNTRMSITELDVLHRNHLHGYDQAMKDGDRSAVDFHSREMDRLEEQITARMAEVDFYDSEDYWSFFRKVLDNLTFFLIVLIMNTDTTNLFSSFDPWADLSDAEFAEFESAMMAEQDERELVEARATERAVASEFGKFV